MAGGKLKRIRLESTIQKLLHRDNGVTAHFDYHIHMNSKKNTVELNLLTFNPVHDEYMLLHNVSGKSSLDCLQKMINYLRENNLGSTEYSYTVTWKRKDTDDEPHVSYFRATSEKQVEEKFLHEKDPSDFEYTIQVNPIT